MWHHNGFYCLQHPLQVEIRIVRIHKCMQRGKSDPVYLITHCLDDSSVSILLGNGDGTFGAARAFPSGSGPAGILLGSAFLASFAHAATRRTTINTMRGGLRDFDIPQHYHVTLVLSGPACRSIDN